MKFSKNFKCIPHAFVEANFIWIKSWNCIRVRIRVKVKVKVKDFLDFASTHTWKDVDMSGYILQLKNPKPKNSENS